MAASLSNSSAGKKSELIEGHDFGGFLRRAREGSSMSLADVAAATRVPRSSLECLEACDIARLPAEVFVRGFIRSFARVVGVAEAEPLARYDRAVKARHEAKRAQSAVPVVDPTIAGIASEEDREGMSSRRGLGLAVFVIILLLIATITLSLLLRRPPPSGEGLSEGRPAAASRAVAASSSHGPAGIRPA
jgi:cytoskeletal protein RodZ